MTDNQISPVLAKPYGILGLILSTLLIVVVSTGLLFAAIAAGYAIGGDGFRSAMDAVAVYEPKQLLKAPIIIQRHFFIALIVVFLLVLPPLLLAARMRGGKHWRELLALQAPVRWPDRKWVLLLIVAAPAYLVASGLLVKTFFPEFKTWFFVPLDRQGMALSFFAVIFLAPFVEEVLFRGWMYTGLRNSFRISTAIAITAVLFAAAHSDGGLIYPALVLVPGIVLGVVREWTGSTWASMLTHAMFNAWAWGLQLAFGDMI